MASSQPLADKIYRKRTTAKSSAGASIDLFAAPKPPIPILPLDTLFFGPTIFRVRLKLNNRIIPVNQERSPGLHLSTVIRAIAIKTRILKIVELREHISDLGVTVSELDKLASTPEFRDDPQFSTTAINRMCCGIAWEDYLASQNPDWAYHFGEVARDGIAGTPDAVWGTRLADTGEAIEIVIEIKLTWKSVNNTNTWMWEAQIKSYCMMMGIKRARLIVMYINGPYGPYEPILQVTDFHFTDQELAENWYMISQYARKHFDFTTGLEIAA